MAQSSISSFFITRKRGIDDDLIAQKKKVICLERTQAEIEDSVTVAVFPKILDNSSLNDDEPKTMVKNQKPNQKAMRQGIAPQRTTRYKKVHMQEVDGIEAPKVVNFWKGGNLSPQKKSKVKSSETIIMTETKNTNNASHSSGMLTPVKVNTSSAQNAIEKTSLISNNGSSLDEIKKRIKGSSRLADLKTSLNKLNGGLDKLDRTEKKRLSCASVVDKSEASIEMTKTLKPFKTIELEILR